MITESVWATVKTHPWKYRARAKPITGILWHSTRGNQGYDGNTELNAFCNWMRSPNNRNPGAPAYGVEPYAGISSVGIGPGRIVEVVPDTYIPAWSSWQSDERKLSVEVAQSNLGQAIEAETIAECVKYARAKSVEYGFPLTRVFPTHDDTWIGMAGHEDTQQGKASGKSDPGPEFWTPFMAALSQEEPMTNAEKGLIHIAAELDNDARLFSTYDSLAAAGFVPIQDGDDLNAYLRRRFGIIALAASDQANAAYQHIGGTP